MRVKSLAANMTEITTGKWGILVSYETPVAAYDKDTSEYLRTEKKFSPTTTKHINKWLDGCNAKEMQQDFFEMLLDS